MKILKEENIIKEAKKNFDKWNESRNDKKIKYGQCKSVKYWFVADEEDIVLSFYKSTEPRVLKIHRTKSGRTFVVSGRSHNTKTHYIHRLQAEAFPDRVYSYGKAKDYLSLEGLEVHHMKCRTINKPECEEILEPKVHDVLFDKRIVPNISDDESRQIKYMKQLLNVVLENTPNQSVVVFSGSGIKNGIETKNLAQVIYADDFSGVNEIVKQSISKLATQKYIMYKPEKEEDREEFQNLIENPGEAKQLEEYVIRLYNIAKKELFYTNYKGINMLIHFLV